MTITFFTYNTGKNNIPKSITLHISSKANNPWELQQRHFIEYQNISRNYKQINVHQQIYSFQECKQILDTTKGMQHWHVSPRALYQIKLSFKVYDYMRELL